MVPPGQWFTRKPLLTLKFSSVYVHRSTLPQSRIRSTAPSEREPGQHPPQCQSPARWMFCQRAGDFWVLCGGGYILPFNRVLAKPWGYGRFSSPLRNSEWLTAPIHRGTLPQSAALPAPSGREPGNAPHNANHPPAGCCVSGRLIFWILCGGIFSIQPGACETVGLRAIFIAPTKALKFLHFTIRVGGLFLVVVGLFLGVHGFVCFSGELFYGVGWVVCGEGAAGGEA